MSTELVRSRCYVGVLNELVFWLQFALFLIIRITWKLNPRSLICTSEQYSSRVLYYKYKTNLVLLQTNSAETVFCINWKCIQETMVENSKNILAMLFA
jgi:hypothetical protein